MLNTGLNLVTAGRGDGKTTFLRNYAIWAAGRRLTIGGIASPAVFENGQRVGYDLLDIRRGTARQLARVVASPDLEATVGIYKFDDQAVAEGNAAIVSAMRGQLDVVVIDEVGPLELRGGGWAPALGVALRELVNQQTLIITVRPSLLDELPLGFPSQWWKSANRISPPWPDLDTEPGRTA